MMLEWYPRPRYALQILMPNFGWPANIIFQEWPVSDISTYTTAGRRTYLNTLKPEVKAVHYATGLECIILLSFFSQTWHNLKVSMKQNDHEKKKVVLLNWCHLPPSFTNDEWIASTVDIRSVCLHARCMCLIHTWFIYTYRWGNRSENQNSLFFLFTHSVKSAVGWWINLCTKL